MFFIIATLVPGLLALNWFISLQPRLKAQVESNAIALANSHAYSLAEVLTPRNGKVQRDDIIRVLDDILLLTDPNTKLPFIHQIAIELDYDVIPLKKGSLDIKRGREKPHPSSFVTEIPLYSITTRELLGIATFHVSSEGFHNLQHEVVNDLLLGAGSAILLLIFFWSVVFFLLGPLNVIINAIKGMQKGEYDQIPTIKTSEELNRISSEFNSMSHAIKDREDKLVYSQTRIRKLFERVEHAIFRMDADFKVIESNKMFDLLCERDTDFFCLISEEKRDELLQKAIKGNLVGKEIEINARDGNIHTISLSVYPEVEENGSISGFDGHFVDITAQKRMEEALLQNQKLESLGLLAGGIAHDFNNILTVINGYSELAFMNLALNDPMHEQMKSILEQGRKASALTRQLLAFSRKQVMELKVINLNTIINNLTKMLGRLIGETIETKLRLHSSIGNIRADPGQIEQIIMNLAVNAKDAMPDGGKLIVQTNSIALDEEYCRSRGELTPGSYILLTVTDNGQGMSSEVKEKIFDPFFTTKAKGAGTGLGLSTVYGIVKQLKGDIFVYSEPGRGTTFKMYFPEIHEAAEDVVVKTLPEADLRGTETIMVVDDEASIRHLVRDTLQPLGYNMIEASNGEDALETIRTLGVAVDLLLTDVIMPGMSGKELADTLKNLQSDVKLVFMSGYTDEIIAYEGVLEPGTFFVYKPLIPSDLRKKIREILDHD